MRTRHTMTISLPPAMVKEFEKVRKAENRTNSELVREALRTYFALHSQAPEVTASKSELAAIRSGRSQIKRGQYVTLHQLLHDLEPADRTPRRKRT